MLHLRQESPVETKEKHRPCEPHPAARPPWPAPATLMKASLNRANETRQLEADSASFCKLDENPKDDAVRSKRSSSTRVLRLTCMTPAQLFETLCISVLWPVVAAALGQKCSPADKWRGAHNTALLLGIRPNACVKKHEMAKSVRYRKRTCSEEQNHRNWNRALCKGDHVFMTNSLNPLAIFEGSLLATVIHVRVIPPNSFLKLTAKSGCSPTKMWPPKKCTARSWESEQWNPCNSPL